MHPRQKSGKDHRKATSVLKIKASVKNSQSKRQKDLHWTFTLDSKRQIKTTHTGSTTARLRKIENTMKS